MHKIKFLEKNENLREEGKKGRSFWRKKAKTPKSTHPLKNIF